jgi:hypothetical protein
MERREDGKHHLVVIETNHLIALGEIAPQVQRRRGSHAAPRADAGERLVRRTDTAWLRAVGCRFSAADSPIPAERELVCARSSGHAGCIATVFVSHSPAAHTRPAS